MGTPMLLETAIYPETDGKPVGETDVHRQEILETIAALQEYFRRDERMYVSGNLMFYYEEGNSAAVVSPDVFVVRGVENKLRRTYKLWEEHVPPAVVMEVSSRSTRLEDLGNKRALYGELGVREYFLFDPLGEYLKPPLQGFRLDGLEYVAVAPRFDGRLESTELGLLVAREGHKLALFDAATGERLLRPPELAEAFRAEEAARRAAEERAASLEAELERMRAQLHRLQGDAG